MRVRVRPEQLEQPHASTVGRASRRIGRAVAGPRDALTGFGCERAAPVAHAELHGLLALGAPVLHPATGQQRGQAEHVHRHRKALGAVGVQQRRFRNPQHVRELPAEVACVLDAGVHALGAARRVHVRGVTGEEHAIDPVAVDHPDVQPPARGPDQLPEAHPRRDHVDGRLERLEGELQIGRAGRDGPLELERSVAGRGRSPSQSPRVGPPKGGGGGGGRTLLTPHRPPAGRPHPGRPAPPACGRRPFAREPCDGAAAASTTRTGTSHCASAQASASPVGPAPTTRTSCSMSPMAPP